MQAKLITIDMSVVMFSHRILCMPCSCSGKFFILITEGAGVHSFCRNERSPEGSCRDLTKCIYSWWGGNFELIWARPSVHLLVCPSVRLCNASCKHSPGHKKQSYRLCIWQKHWKLLYAGSCWKWVKSVEKTHTHTQHHVNWEHL